MIISHKHKFIFFPVPKTGTHSVRQALRDHLGDEDLEQVGLFIKKRFPFPEFSGIEHGHISVKEIQPVLGEPAFASLLKFAFVRNPFDRFVSYCAFTSRDSNYFEVSPQKLMKYIIKERRPLDHLLYKPQHTFLVDQSGKLAMDFIGRTESMQTSYDELCAKIGVPSQVLARTNSTVHRPYQEYFDKELIDLVGDLYRVDLEMFGYRFE